MRNIIILACALALGAGAADAHMKIRGCRSAKIFLKKHGKALDALFSAEATGHLKTMQDMGQIKLNLLRELANSDTPYGPACRKIGKKLHHLAFAVSVKKAAMKLKDTETGMPDLIPATKLLPAKAEADEEKAE